MTEVRVVCVITGLDVGGAELTLLRLLKHVDRQRFRLHVISLLPAGQVGEEIRRLGIEVESLGMRRGRPSVRALVALGRRLRTLRPDVVQTWMYHADLVGGVAAAAARVPRIVWSVHHTSLRAPGTKRRTVAVARTCALLSHRLPAAVACCSRAGRQAHEQLGYAADRLVYVPNGYDLDEFVVDPPARDALRKQLGLPPTAPLVGLIARHDPQKDHAGFLRAARLCLDAVPSVHFVLCGERVTADNGLLAAQAAPLGDHVHLLGPRPDVARIMAGLDVGALASLNEAFPNVVAEMMACGVPCVVTRVGDTSDIVGDAGLVVPPGDPRALADALVRLLRSPHEERDAWGRRARERIATHFGIEKMVTSYAALWDPSPATDHKEPATRSHTASRS